MKLIASIVLALSIALPSVGQAAGIEGIWKTANGSKVKLYGCGSAICASVLSGKHKGIRIGANLNKKSEGLYVGSLVNPVDQKTYAGKAQLVSAKLLKVQGCAMKVFCASETWTRSN